MKVKKLLSLLLVLILALGLLPVTALADGGQVCVIVENTTFLDASQSNGGSTSPAWTGTKVDTTVPITGPGMTMMDAIVAALETAGITAENGRLTATYGEMGGYISGIDGLDAFDGMGASSGWMGTLNDWFVNRSFVSFGLQDGDVIRVMYTNANSGGTDLGGTWDNNNKWLSALAFSAGSMTPAFSAGTTSYTLTLPAGTSGVTLTPTAANKNFQVRAITGTESFDSVRWGERTLSVTDCGMITVTCGCTEPLWPSMNNGPYPGANAESVPAVTYTIYVDIEGAATPTFTADLGGTPAIYTVEQASAPLNVAATATDGGDISYQWYVNTTNSTTGGTPVGTGTSYTPSTAAYGTKYYYAIATNTQGGSTASASSKVATVITVLRGDLNGSNSVSPADGTVLKQYFAGRLTLSETQRVAADVNGSGSVTPSDGTKLKQYLSGRIGSLD
jgi:hypothetical protein